MLVELIYIDTWGSIYNYDGSFADSQMDFFDKNEKAYRHNFLSIRNMHKNTLCYELCYMGKSSNIYPIQRADLLIVSLHTVLLSKKIHNVIDKAEVCSAQSPA